MSNMSYCRFENTLRDFTECSKVLEEMLVEATGENLSRDEFRAAVKLMAAARDLALLVTEQAGRQEDVESLTDEDIESMLTQNESFLAEAREDADGEGQ